MLSLSCPCGDLGSTCPKTKRSCSGIVQLRTIRNLTDDQRLHRAEDRDSLVLQLSADYVLDLSEASLAPCDVCLCGEDDDSKESNTMVALRNQMESTRQTLEEIDQQRKVEGSLLKSDSNEDESLAHFKKVLRLCQQELEKCRSLSPWNILRLRLVDHAFDAAIHAQEWNVALRLGQETLGPFRSYHSSPHPTVGLQLLKVAKLMVFLQPPSAATASLLADAKEMLKVTHGPDSEVLKEADDLSNQVREELRAREAFEGLSIKDKNRVPFAIRS